MLKRCVVVVEVRVPPLAGSDLQSVLRWIRQAAPAINDVVTQSNNAGAFFVWNRGCVTVPTNTTISGAHEIVFPSDFTGNGTIGGTLDVTGNIDPTTYETTNGGFLDEDAMGSDAADKVASQQSIKAYVDAHGTVQVVNTQTGAVNTGTTVLLYDDSIPQITEGDEYMTLAITPTSATNKLKIEVVFNFSQTVVAADPVIALFQDATAGALAAAGHYTADAQRATQAVFTHYMTAGTTSETTFKVRAGMSSGTMTFNGVASARKLGGVMASSITITEIKG